MKRRIGARSVSEGACAILALLAISVLTACSSAPTYPQPQGSNGQILVQLQGEPKEGVGKASMREVQDEYSRHRESVEKGKAFERVDYDDLKDVGVIVQFPGPILSDVPLPPPAAGELELDDDGFNRVQLLARKNRPGHKGSATFTLQNLRDTTVHIYGFNETDGSFEGEVSANSLGTIKVRDPGRYDIYCDEDETLHCVLFVTENSYAWIGSSDDDAFFNHVPPGSCEIHVFPPRLPEWSKTINVKAGKRETLKAELTVNNLPKAE